MRIAILADVNDDGSVDSNDVDPFVTALNGESYFYSVYPDGAWFAADCNQDGNINFADIDPFVAILSSG